MTTKNNRAQQQKALAKKKARQVRNAKARHHEHSRGRGTQQKYNPDFIQSYVKEHGIGRAVQDLRLKPEDKDFTSRDVMEIIQQTIPAIINTHAGVEVLDILGKEGTVEISDEIKVAMQVYDHHAYVIAANIATIIQFVEANKEPEDYQELLGDLMTRIDALFNEVAPVLVEVLSANGEAADAYYKEHKQEGEELFDFMQRFHGYRIERYAKVVMAARAADVDGAVQDADWEEVDETAREQLVAEAISDLDIETVAQPA